MCEEASFISFQRQENFDMNVNTDVKRKVPTEMIPRVVRTYGDILLRNKDANEVKTWNIAAQLVWLDELADTQILIKQLLNTSK